MELHIVYFWDDQDEVYICAGVFSALVDAEKLEEELREQNWKTRTDTMVLNRVYPPI